MALDAPYGSFVGATDVDYIATAYYAKSTEILYKTAKILGKEEEYKKEYTQLHKNILETFNQKYVEEDGSLEDKDTDCTYSGSRISSGIFRVGTKIYGQAGTVAERYEL